MPRIQTLSAYLVRIFQVLLILTPVAVLAPWVLMEWEPFRALVAEGLFLSPIDTPTGWVNLAEASLTPWAMMAGLLGGILEVTPFIWGGWILKRIFTQYQAGAIFTRSNAKDYKFLGTLIVMQGLLVTPLAQTCMVLAATLSNPPGQRYLYVSFGTPNLGLILCGACVMVISWVMLEAQKLKEDQAYTV